MNTQKIWSNVEGYERFNQTGYSDPTIFPQCMNYNDSELWKEDMKKAEAREDARNNWIQEIRDEHINGKL